MNWRRFWDRIAAEADPHDQVGRTGGLVPINEVLIQRMTSRMAGLLDLQPTDHLLDLCCGNGLITRALACRCQQTLGIDLAPAQIKQAQRGPECPGLTFRTGDVTRLAALDLPPCDKINLHFSFQYLDRPGQGHLALKGMQRLLRPGGRILLGDVPDRDRLRVFYPRRRDRLRYFLRLTLGRSLMGKFWSEAEIRRLAQPLGLHVERLHQPPDFPYAHYRSDYLLTWR